MITTRFAPSPTGYLHIGGLRTALFSRAYARKHCGNFILRIEDTDLARSTAESVQTILDGMAWAGLDYDSGPVYQTHRFQRYKEAVARLLASDRAYYCYTSKEELAAARLAAEKTGKGFIYDRRWRPEAGKTLPPVPAGVKPVVRFKMPLTGITAWDDLVKGHLEFNNQELDDLIIARADGTPTYNLCVVADDYDGGVTHVIRGDDHVNNTPKQINILRALGDKIPQYAHLPMILNAAGAKMSKRRDAVSVMDYAAQGILPEALLNYLARLGWSKGDTEFFTMEEFISWFDLKDVNPAPARFDMDKLLWLNGEHLKHLDITELARRLTPALAKTGITADQDYLQQVLQLVRERVNNLNDLLIEVSYFFRKATPDAAAQKKFWDDGAAERLHRFYPLLAAIPANKWRAETIQALFLPFCTRENIKMGLLGMPLRLKICGTPTTPALEKVLALLGKKEVLTRLQS